MNKGIVSIGRMYQEVLDVVTGRRLYVLVPVAYGRYDVYREGESKPTWCNQTINMALRKTNSTWPKSADGTIGWVR